MESTDRAGAGLVRWRPCLGAIRVDRLNPRWAGRMQGVAQFSRLSANLMFPGAVFHLELAPNPNSGRAPVVLGKKG